MLPRGVLCKRQQCAACSRLVNIAVEGNDKDIAVLCPSHKEEISYLRNQLEVKNQELQELRTEDKKLTTSLNLKDRELKELQAELRALGTQLAEEESQLQKTLNLIKSKLAKWIKLLKQ